jgi:uncharacterized protein (DUF3820 family)
MEEKIVALLNNFLKSTLPFGKYKGETVEEILYRDRGYIEWLANNTDGGLGLLSNFLLDNEDML